MIHFDSLFQTRNSRFVYYLKTLTKYAYPRSLLTLDYDKFKPALEQYGEESACERLHYYNKINSPFELGDTAQRLKDLSLKDRATMYLLDLMEYARFFPQDYRLVSNFYDITHVPETPTIVKSRPVVNNDNSVLFNLNKLRHFLFVKDPIPFREKQNTLVWRGSVYQPHRIKFMEKLFGKSDLLDIGQYNKRSTLNPQWQVPFMTIKEQLQHKFILAIEGNDVATSTKWIMSSNSLLFMRKPRVETWFMEGRLIPDYHYVMVADDYSDLESLVEYYIDHLEEAERIIKNCSQYVEQFNTPLVEDWLSLKVLEQYFEKSGQS